MMETIKKLFDSKKSVVAMVALVLETLAATNVISLDEVSKVAFCENIAIIAGAYFVGQGVADFGKEKVKAEKSK